MDTPYFTERHSCFSSIWIRSLKPSNLIQYLSLGFLILGLGNLTYAQDTASIGSGTVGNSSTQYPCPLQDFYEGSRSQFLYRASELQAAGMGAGTITALRFEVTNLNGADTIESYNIKIGTTSTTSLGTGWETVSTTVFGTADYLPVTGFNNFVFPSAFSWNGSDNIIIEICNGGADFTSNPTVPWTTGLSFNGSRTYRADGAGSLCTYTGTVEQGTQTTRPNIGFVYNLAPCSNPVMAGLAVSSSAQVCGSELVTLSLSGASGGIGMTYQWQQSSDSITWSNISGATGFTHDISISTPTYFRCVLTCSAGTPANSGHVLVTLDPGVALPNTQDFEGIGTGIWNQIPSSGYAWLTYSGSTPSSPTGPDIDHTLGTGSGTYIYTEASNGGSGNVAILESECLNFTGVSAPILSFWYHMYGTNIDTLWIEGTSDGINWSVLDSLPNQQQTSGANIDPWKNRFVAVPTNNARLRFRLVSQGCCTGDAALDDIQLFGADSLDVSLSNATTAFGCGSNDSVEVTITNLGYTTLTSVPISYSLNGGATQSAGTYSGSLTLGESTTFIFPVTLGSGGQSVEVFHGVTADLNTSNDTSSAAGANPLTLSGTYTLGGALADFASFADLEASLTTCGVSGPTIINVNASAGPYMERVRLAGINGLSATNTLTINGNGAEIQYDGGSEGSDYRLLTFGVGVKHVTVDNLRLIELGTSTAFGAHFASNADSNTLTNCVIDLSNCTVNSTTVAGIVVSGSATSYSTVPAETPRDLLIQGNTILGAAAGGAYYGITLYGNSAANQGINNKILNNKVENFYSYGIYVRHQEGVEIKGNDISSLDRTSSTTRYMIYAQTGLIGADISGNYLHDPYGGISSSTSIFYGIYLNAVDGTMLAPNKVYNNIIGNIESNGTQYGIYNLGSDYSNIDHNTISLDYAGGSGTTTYAFYQSTAATGLNLRNNIFSVSRPGAGTTTAAAVRFNTTTSTIVSNNNVFNVDTNITNIKVGYYGPTAFQNLVNWQTANTSAYDANSVEANPVFANPSGDVFTPLALGADNVGSPIGIATDFYGASRSGTSPDAGAIEFTGIPGDLALTDVTLTQQDACYGTSDTINVTVTNVLGSTVDFSTTNLSGSWSVSGPVASSGTFTISTGTLAEGASATYQFTGANMSLPGTYTVSANIDTNALNSSTGNDTLMNQSTDEVISLLTVSPLVTVLTNISDSSNIVAASPLLSPPFREPFFSEICQFRGASTPPGGWPSYLLADDFIEITGVPGTDLNGYTFEEWTTTNTFTVTFGPGTLIGPNGTAVFATGELGASSPDSSNFYYHTGRTASHSSGVGQGYLLKDAGGNIIDAAEYEDSYGGFPAASGVTSSDWSGTPPNTGSTAGMRLIENDENLASNWVQANQDPNVANANVTVPGPGGATAGFQWNYLSAFYDSLNTSNVGPFTTTGDTLTFVATFNSTCGMFTDSVIVITDFIIASLDSSTNVSCFGGSDGTASASGSGGEGAPYTYLWSDGQTTATATGLAAGTYTATVYDSDNFTDSVSVTLTEPTAIANSFTIVPSGCGAANGSATASVSGGTSPYTYAWSGSPSTAALAGTLTSGTYQLTVTDGNGCTLSDTATVNDAGAPTVTFTITDAINCFGGSDGEITAGVTGGATPYTYAWSAGGSTTNVATGLTSGSYILTVTDNLGCAVSGTQSISQPTLLTATASVGSNTSCNGTSDGTATAVAAGGTTAYTYLWSNGATTAAVTGLGANTYTATVTDANGCVASTAPINVTEPAVLATTITVNSNVSCNGLSDGILTAASTGGTTAYTYLWSNGTATAANSGVAAATYTVTTTDANGCTTTATSSITEPTVLVASISGSNDATCFGFSDGDATATATGGTTAYTYSWSSAATAAQATGLAAGSYTVTITDANGCTDAESVTIGEPTMLTASIIDTTDATCFGFVDGASEVSANGGTTPYTYLWTNSSTTAAATGFAAGLQSVTITDANNCTITESVLISEPTQLMNSFSVADLSCNNSNDGEAASTPSGSVAPYMFMWSNAATSDTISGLSAGNYSLTITDDNGCILTDSVTVTQPDSLISAVDNIADLDCNGDADGAVTVSATGGTMPYSYLWDNAADSSSIIGLSGGTYSATVTDDNGCTSEISAMVQEPEVLTSALTANDASCFGLSDGSIANLVEGGTAPYSYEWSNASTDADLADAGAGSYSVTVTDTNGCSAEASADVSEPDSIDNGASIAVTNAIVSLTASADSATYQWIDCASGLPVAGADAKVFVPQANGSYAVIVTVGACSDTSDCQDVGNVGVNYVSNNNSMSIFPNPTRDNFNLKFEGEFGNDIRIDIVDIQGKLVSSRTIVNVTNGHVETINGSMSSGVYFVRAYNNDQLMIQRLIVN